MDSASVARRLRAARALEDITVEQLAARIGAPGLGAKTLGAIERETRSMRPQERAPIAEALNVPAEFFTADSPWTRAPVEGASIAGNSERLDTLTGELYDLRRTVLEKSDDILSLRSEVLGRIYERLIQMDGRLTQIDQRLDGLEAPSLEELSRRSKQALVGRRADVDGSTQAGSGTREPGEATPEAPPARVRGTRRSE